MVCVAAVVIVEMPTSRLEEGSERGSNDNDNKKNAQHAKLSCDVTIMESSLNVVFCSRTHKSKATENSPSDGCTFRSCFCCAICFSCFVVILCAYLTD